MPALDLGAIWASLGPVAGIVLGWWLSRRSQREGWQREDRNRAHKERVDAFAAFLVAMEARLDWLVGGEQRQRVEEITGTVQEWGDYDGPDPETPLQTIAILAPDVEKPAQDLYSWTQLRGLDQLARTVKRLGVKAEDKPWMDVGEFHALRDSLVAAMRENLT